MCLMPYANNKGADQPAHPRSLISTFVVCCLDNMICILAQSKVSRFWLGYAAEQATLFARSFRRRFFAYRYPVNHPHTNIILA